MPHDDEAKTTTDENCSWYQVSCPFSSSARVRHHPTSLLRHAETASSWNLPTTKHWQAWTDHNITNHLENHAGAIRGGSQTIKLSTCAGYAGGRELASPRRQGYYNVRWKNVQHHVIRRDQLEQTCSKEGKKKGERERERAREHEWERERAREHEWGRERARARDGENERARAQTRERTREREREKRGGRWWQREDGFHTSSSNGIHAFWMRFGWL